jgi:hypothetical protein
LVVGATVVVDVQNQPVVQFVVLFVVKRSAVIVVEFDQRPDPEAIEFLQNLRVLPQFRAQMDIRFRVHLVVPIVLSAVDIHYRLSPPILLDFVDHLLLIDTPVPVLVEPLEPLPVDGHFVCNRLEDHESTE